MKGTEENISKSPALKVFFYKISFLYRESDQVMMGSLSLNIYEINKSYRTHGIVKEKIESFSSRFSIFYDSMSSDCDLSHALSPRNPRLVANHRLFVFDTQTGRRVR